MRCRLNFREVHRRLGCAGCRWADARAVARGKPCCTYAGVITTDAKEGRCKQREDKGVRHADVLHELKEKREAFKKVHAEWTAKLKRLEEEAEMLGEAVRLKSDESEQSELPLPDGGKDGLQ